MFFLFLVFRLNSNHDLVVLLLILVVHTAELFLKNIDTVSDCHFIIIFSVVLSYVAALIHHSSLFHCDVLVIKCLRFFAFFNMFIYDVPINVMLSIVLARIFLLHTASIGITVFSN